MAPTANGNNQPSQPIPFEGRHGRRRSDSGSESSESSASPTTPLSSNPPFPTPASGLPPRVASISPSSSPILSYFLSQSAPKSPTNTFSFRRNVGPPVIEDDEFPEGQQPLPKHSRRASTAWAGSERFAQPPAVPPNEQQDRAAGMLRRLSLGGALGRPPFANSKPTGGAGGNPDRSNSPPSVPPAKATSPTPRRARRANTISPGSQRLPRAPSPMGERILKGHFDGFN